MIRENATMIQGKLNSCGRKTRDMEGKNPSGDRAATVSLPNFEEVRCGLEAAKAAGASCFRYEFDSRVMIFDLGGAASGERSEADKWFASKNGTS